MKYYTRDNDFELVEIEEDIVNDVLRQYFEKRYIGAIVLSSFIIGFLLGIIAYAI